MKKLSLFVCCALLSACTGLAVHEPDVMPSLSSGLDTTGFDREVRAADNLFLHVNGTWLASTEIPADKSNFGSFGILADQSDKQLKAIIEDASQIDAPADSELRKIGDFHKAYMNTELTNALGAKPLSAELDRIDAVTSRQALAAYLGRAQGINTRVPLAIWIGQDSKNTDQYLVNFTQSGLGLPDRDYYLSQDQKFKDIRKDYLSASRGLLGLIGLDVSDQELRELLAFETAIARAQWTRTEARNRDKTYNKVDRDELIEKLSALDMPAYLKAAGIEREAAYNLRQPDFAVKFSKIAATTRLDIWRLYLKLRLVSAAAPYLSDEFVEADFAFRQKRLQGIEQNRPRWKRAVQDADNLMGEMIGKIYVERHFQPEAKTRMDALVGNLIEAFRSGIDELQWMSPQTRAEARNKLNKLNVKIGYPDQWTDYTALQISENDLYGNIERANRFHHARELTKLGGPVNRDEWFMSPQTVNAYYSPGMNEIVFPAAILQPPFFNVNAEDAVNYGAIGAVIGHEISHGFDDQGRKSDGNGTLRNWWTESDNEQFTVRAKGLVEQYNSFEALPGEFVNGEFTLGENIGDLSGLAVAYKAYKKSLSGADGPEIDGFSADQRFFMGWAQVWRRKYRDSELQRRLLVDSHSPSEFRVLGVLPNIEAFYQAFDVDENDQMYLAPEKRVKIW